MARLRVFLALLSLTLGAMLGGLGLSGYYEPSAPGMPRPSTGAGTPQPAAESQPAALQGRLRFLARDEPKAASLPAKPKPAKAPVAKPKPPTKERPEARARPQQAAAPWPWSLLGN